jgi:hypothetical protein
MQRRRSASWYQANSKLCPGFTSLLTVVGHTDAEEDFLMKQSRPH